MEEFLSFARHQFELSQPQGDGTPLLAHLTAHYERTGKVHPLLADAPPLPQGCRQLWDDFLELHGSRSSAGLGVARITFLDIDGWQRVKGVQLNAWELDCIRKVDDLWLADFAPKPKEAAN